MKLVLKLLAVCVCGVVVVLALIPWRLKGSAWRDEIGSEIQMRTGLAVRVGGPITVKLLPRPRLQVANVSVSAPDGTVSVDAPMVFGDLDIPSTLRGQLRLVSATLAGATVTTDIDSGHFPTTLLDTGAHRDSALPFRLALRSAVVRLKSVRPGLDTLLTDVNATAHHHADPTGSLALSGDAVWHGVHGQFTFSVERPDLVLKAGNSPASLMITSPVGMLSAAGDLTGGAQAQFAGHLAISTPALSRLASVLEIAPVWVGAQRASLSGTALAKHDDLSLSDGILRLDDTTFEGTLGFHGDKGRNLLEGTLATALLDVDKLAGHKLDQATLATFYRTPFAAALSKTNLDLRISANTALVGHTEVQDAALSALFHDGRLEVTIDEAHAYAGVIRARAVALLHTWGAEAHADLNLSGIDVGALSSAWSGAETVTGAMNGKLSIDGRGNTISDFVRSMSGEGQATVERGRFVGVSISQALKRLTRRLPLSEDETGQITVFASASAGIGIVDGMMHLIDGKLIGPGIKLDFGGQSDLPRGKLDITAVATQTDPTGSVLPDGATLPFRMRGTWGAPLLVMQRANVFTAPPLPLPLLDDPPGLP